MADALTAAPPGPPSLRSGLPSRSAWAGQRVFLTGHTGFKGSWLAVWLQHLGATVTGFSLPPEPGGLGERLGHTSGIGDIRDLPALRGAMAESQPATVFHLAAQPLVRESYASPLDTLQTNVLGTAHVLEAARTVASVRAVVVVTTDKVYANREWPWPYRETDALGGHDPYSASKACAELVAACWRASFFQDAAAIATARAGNVIGGGDWAADRLIPDCVRAFASGATVRIRNPAATRPWQHVLDPLNGYLLLAERLLGGAAGAAWNFGPPPSDVLPVTDVVRLFAEAWGGGASWAVDAGPHPHEAGLLAVDAAMARHDLGWAPRIPLPEALRRTAAWYREALAGAGARTLMLAEVNQFEMGHAA